MGENGVVLGEGIDNYDGFCKIGRKLLNKKKEKVWFLYFSYIYFLLELLKMFKLNLEL